MKTHAARKVFFDPASITIGRLLGDSTSQHDPCSFYNERSYKQIQLVALDLNSSTATCSFNHVSSRSFKPTNHPACFQSAGGKEAQNDEDVHTLSNK
jgi:hypothetical protein